MPILTTPRQAIVGNSNVSRELNLGISPTQSQAEPTEMPDQSSMISLEETNLNLGFTPTVHSTEIPTSANGNPTVTSIAEISPHPTINLLSSTTPSQTNVEPQVLDFEEINISPTALGKDGTTHTETRNYLGENNRD